MRFIRSADESAGAGTAEVELTIAGRICRGAARRYDTTVELDLSQVGAAAGEVDLGAAGDLASALLASPMGLGALVLRVVLPPDVMPERLASGPGRPARLRYGFELARPIGLRWAESWPVSVMPLHDLTLGAFLELFRSVFAPSDLGLFEKAEVEGLAHSLWEGSPVEGVADYEGLVLMRERRPIGVFFVRAGSPDGASLGFAGVMAEFRRTRQLRSALRAACAELQRRAAFPLRFEVDWLNHRSIAMARRRCGAARYLAAVYRPT